MAYSLDYYRSWRNRISSQIADRRRKNNQLNSEISQLQTAYNKLKRIKDDYASPIRNDVKRSKCVGDVRWRGQHKKEFDKVLDDNVKNDAKTFVNSIDAMLDEVGRAIHSKRSQLDSGSRVINSLQRTYSWISSEIRNLTN